MVVGWQQLSKRIPFAWQHVLGVEFNEASLKELVKYYKARARRSRLLSFVSD